MKKIVGKVSDFDIIYGNGVITCCGDDIMMRSNEDAYVGMVIECIECGAEMILRMADGGKLKWMAYVD